MTTVEASTAVEAPADALFAVLADARLLSSVSDLTVEVHGDPGRPLQRGDRFEQRIRILGIPLDTEWEVTDIDEPRRIVVAGTGPAGATASVAHDITGDGTGSTLRMVVEYELPAGVLGEAVDHLLVERKSR